MTTKNRLIRDDEGDAKPVAQRAAELSTETDRAPEPGARGTYPGMRKITCYVEPETFRWLHSMRLDTNRTIVDLGREALTEFVKRYAAQKRFGG